MSTYPGEDPQQPADPSSSSRPPAEGGPGASREDQEHTGPVTPGSSGPVFNPSSVEPTSAYEQGYPPPYAGPPAEPSPYQQQQPYGGQNPYPAMPPGYPPPPSAPGYGAPYAGYAPSLPNHPQSTTALVLGLVGLVGGLMLCGLPLLVSPFAWALGRNSLKEIKAAPGRWGGESNARAGMIMGIIGSALLALALVAIVLFVVVLVATGSGSTGTI